MIAKQSKILYEKNQFEAQSLQTILSMIALASSNGHRSLILEFLSIENYNALEELGYVIKYVHILYDQDTIPSVWIIRWDYQLEGLFQC